MRCSSGQLELLGDRARRRPRPRLDALRAACRQADAAREHARARPGAASAVTSLRVAEDILADARSRLPVQSGGRRRAARDQRPAGDERHRARFRARASSTPRSAAYNEAVRQFPTVLVARLFSFRAAAAF